MTEAQRLQYETHRGSYQRNRPMLPYWDDVDALVDMYNYLLGVPLDTRECHAAVWCQTLLPYGRLPQPDLRAKLIKTAMAAGWKWTGNHVPAIDELPEISQGEHMRIQEMFPRKYLSGEDLAAKAWTLTIARLEQIKMSPGRGAPPTEKWVMYFETAQRGLILCRTLAFQIAEALGSDNTEDWVGQRITIYPEEVFVGGKKRLGIRARQASSETAQLP